MKSLRPPYGQMYIVMGYYEAETLKQKLERGPLLPVKEAVDIAAEDSPRFGQGTQPADCSFRP